MKPLSLLSVFLLIMALFSCSKDGGEVSIVVSDAGNDQIVFAEEMLQRALDQHIVPEGEWVVELKEVSRSPKEGYTISRNDNKITICGNDGAGVIYGADAFIEQSVLGIGEGHWTLTSSVVESPETKIRGCSFEFQNPYTLPKWYYEQKRWSEFLDMMAENRLNTLFLPDFLVVEDSTALVQNKNILRFLSDEAHRRAITLVPVADSSIIVVNGVDTICATPQRMSYLEPWRWAAPKYISQAVKEIHSSGSGILNLSILQSLSGYPFTSDILPEGKREQQLDRDWMWYKAWSRYAWKQNRDGDDEEQYWNQQLAYHYQTTIDNAELMCTALYESGEIAPNLFHHFGITSENRQTFLLGMLCSQLVNPKKYAEGIELAPEVGTLPVEVTEACLQHAQKAIEAVDEVSIRRIAKSKRSEFLRLRNDMYCYRDFAYAFMYKAQACRKVYDYKQSHNVARLEEAYSLLEQSIGWWRGLVMYTHNGYLYANSLQTEQRQIPVPGTNGKYTHWSDMFSVYEQEMDHLDHNIQTIKEKIAKSQESIQDSVFIARPFRTQLVGRYNRGWLRKGYPISNDKLSYYVDDVADEIKNLITFTFDETKMQKGTCSLEFVTEYPINLLVGYYRDELTKYASAPTFDTDSIDGLKKTELIICESDTSEIICRPLLQSAIRIKGMPLVDVYSYHFQTGYHKFPLPQGICLVVGFTVDPIQPRNVGLSGNSDRMDWLFN